MKKINIDKKTNKVNRPYFVLNDNETSSLRFIKNVKYEGSEINLLLEYKKLSEKAANFETLYLQSIKENSVKYE